MGEAAGYSGRSGPRVRRRLARRLFAHDHRSGPAAVRLLFERFLYPDRVSMPDFDIDFCQDRRDEVIGYVQQRYGAKAAWRKSFTFGTLLARGVMRDVGRVLEMP